MGAGVVRNGRAVGGDKWKFRGAREDDGLSVDDEGEARDVRWQRWKVGGGARVVADGVRAV